MIPKSPDADSIDKYRPIALANFKFKILSKILADRLASILPNIISKEQRGFIKGRNIKDCIAITSEAINLLDKKCFGGNLALKIDISKAFDTLRWDFLLKVLNCFGFNSTFCHWIHVILQSAKVSISINGSQHGFFNCNRGVRQGDPLSPLIVDEGKVSLINGTREVFVPSHCFYVDDLMVFCKGKNSSLISLKELFTKYATCLGQIVNINKSSIYAGGISDRD